MRRLTPAQIRALTTIRDDGNADGLYYSSHGPNPRLANATTDRVLEALRKRGLVSHDGCWTITDDGRRAIDRQKESG